MDKFADIAEYTYNLNGIRTSKKANGFTTNFFLNDKKILRQQDASNELTFYYGADGITGFHLTNNIVYTDYFYKKNKENDIIGIYSTNGDQIAKYEYDAWGNCIAKYLQSDGTYAKIEEDYNYNDTSIINRFVAFKNPFRYRSYYYDFETNIYYLNSRYYDPETGRFVNADDVSALDVTKITINGLNLYAYCLNNPINEVDEDGYFISFLIGLLIAAAIGAAVGVISYIASVIVEGVTTGNWDWSWGDFLGSVVGGAVGGMFSMIPVVGSYVSAFVTGLTSTVLSDAFNHSIYGTEFNLKESLKSGFINGFVSLAFVGIMEMKYSISGVTWGHGSWGEMADQIFEGFRKGFIQNICLKTFGKMLCLSLYGSILDILKSGLK